MNLVNFSSLDKIQLFFCSGDVEWGCGFQSEMISDKEKPGFWQHTNFCPKYIHLSDIQSTQHSNAENDYEYVHCIVLR